MGYSDFSMDFIFADYTDFSIYKNSTGYSKILSKKKGKPPFGDSPLKDFEEASANTEPPANRDVENIVRSITTKCKSLGHTAQDARKHQFAMMDHFELNSLFLTITPDDECSFRVRLYANPDNKVSWD